MSRVLLFGPDGQIGWRLAQLLVRSHELIMCRRSQADLSDSARLRDAIRAVKPDVILNAAAYTAVDQAEKEPAMARAVNAIAPGVMAEEAARLHSLLVHFSTDYVFDGRKSGPYTEEDKPAPLNVYGESKLEGEQHIQATSAVHLILRTSWVYDSRGQNFVLTMLRLGRERHEIRIVNDQTGSPNWAKYLAETTVDIVGQLIRSEDRRRLAGTYHLSASGHVTWFEFARAIFAHPSVMRLCKAPKLVPISSSEYPTLAKRPANSTLSTRKLSELFEVTNLSWRDGLDQCLQQLQSRQ